MTVDEMTLISRLKDVEPLRTEAFEQARVVLRAAMAVDGSPVPVPARPLHQRRRRTLAAWSTVGVGVAAAVTALVVMVTSTAQPAASTHRPGAGTPGATAEVAAPLVRLADYITVDHARPVGDATLVIRATTYPNRAPSSGADLFTDSGGYFYAASESGLPAEITADDNIGGGFAREVAAAIYAVNGNLATARERMAKAALDPHVHTSEQAALKAAQARAKSMGITTPLPTLPPGSAAQEAAVDNQVWENSIDALSAGAGNPQVRAGVLRLLSTVREATVTNTTTGRQPTLTLTAGAPAFPVNYQETLTINARTGVPVAFTGGVPGQTRPDVSITYQVSRVTLSDIAAGKFDCRREHDDHC